MFNTSTLDVTTSLGMASLPLLFFLILLAGGRAELGPFQALANIGWQLVAKVL